tara:strand:- start:1224 stop:1661 length:438 start_codon:yes stop_codon:yes gene_type:complete
MAAGDLVVFDESRLALLDGTHDLNNNTFKCMLITNAVTAAAGDVTPAKADYTEVTGTGYTAGGETLTVVPLAEAAGTVTYDFSTNPAWTQNGAGFTNAYQAIIYNDTNVGKEALIFIDLAGPVSLVAGNVSITWNASGVFTLASA